MKQGQFTLRWVVVLFAAILIGSSAFIPASLVFAQVSSPVLAAVQPDRAANDLDTRIEISGSGFSTEGGIPLVFLNSVPLPGVIWVNENILTATVPWGLNAGVYNLRVVNLDGEEATLNSAFEVIQGVGRWSSRTMDGGPVHAVIPILAVPGLLYAHSEVTSAIYRSMDYAEHWETVGHAGGQYLAYDPLDPDYLYLNALQSTDGGVTWHSMLDQNLWPGTTRYLGNYTRVFPDPGNAGTLFLAAAEIPAGCGEPAGLLRSENYGQTWNKIETGLLPGDNHVTALEFAGSTIYLGTRDGNLYRSVDGGTSWQPIGSSNILESIGILEANPYETNELWITTHFAVSATAQIVKLDLGNLEDLESATDQLTGWSPESYPKSLGFVAEDTIFIGAQWDNGWISDDDGASWDLFQPSTGKPGYWLALDPWDSDQDTFYIADEQYGVQKTANASGPNWSGASWTPVNQGLHAMSPDYLEVDPTNPARVYAKIVKNGWPGIFISDDGGQNWTFSSLEPASGGIRPVTSMLTVSGDRVFAGAHGDSGAGPQLYISEDQGASWTRLSLDPVPEFSDSFHMPKGLKADPRQNDILLMNVIVGNRSLTTDQYVSEIYRSTDHGDHWQRVGLAKQVGREVNNLATLAFDPANPDIAYAAADHEILKSTDNGLTWSIIHSEPASWLGGSIAIEPVAPHRVYVGNLVSKDGGETWDPANYPIGAGQLVFIPGSDTLYIAGDGLAVSPDGGTTWQIPEGPLASAHINALAAGRIDQRTFIYVGTPGGETPEMNLSPDRFAAGAPASLEAGVYRMTKVDQRLFLPVVKR